MSQIVNNNILVGEAGDILMENNEREIFFFDLRYKEVDGVYVRLLDLPPIRSVDYTYDIILAITMHGELMVIDNDHPQGLEVELSIPPLKRIYGTTPISVLDMEDTLHFLDIAKLVEDQYGDSINMSKYYQNVNHRRYQFKSIRFGISNPGIQRVKGVSYSGTLVSEWNEGDFKINGGGNMAILTRDNILINERSFLVANNLSISESLEMEVMMRGDLLIYQDGTIDNLILNGDELQRINLMRVDYQIIDAIDDHGGYIYTLDDQGILRRHGRRSGVMPGRYYNTESQLDILKTEFIPDRLLSVGDDYIERVFVEDIDGNLYKLPKLKLKNYPIRLINPNISPSKGRTLKSAKR